LFPAGDRYARPCLLAALTWETRNPLFASNKNRSIVKSAQKPYIKFHVVLASLSDEALLSF